ncbi:hypothetical protein [Nocardiopsis nanhaiensis]
MAEQGRTGRSGPGRGLVVGVCLFGAVALLGALLGPLWWWLAPRPEVAVLGDGEVFPGTSEEVFAGEGYFVLITAVAGLVTGFGTYMVQFALSRRRFQDLRLVCLVAGALGSAAASLLVWRIGTALDAPAREAVLAADAGETVTAALQLQATAFLIVWPFVHILQYGLLDGISLLRGDQPGVPGPAPAQDAAEGSEGPEKGADPAQWAAPAQEGQEPPTVTERDTGPEDPRR